MSSDISRQRFDPVNDFAAVLMQQGRVLLDADWNEWVEILDRRLRVETTDIIGRCVVPKETPDGFRIGIAGANLTIGPGRMYVDGLLAENHGGPPQAWKVVPAELRGTTPVPYDQQPYLPEAATVAPLPQRGGPHLVYLDVWRREVTPLQDPRLIENAVGVDSTTRWQTAWQVRVLADVGEGVTCATPDTRVPGWLDLTRPSDGRLTTGTFDDPGEPTPCEIPPTGGYKGLENRLYRVEIHTVDPLTGEATFKWARHNASVATAVVEIDGDELVVDLVGRDADLRFHAGDWVEITDDVRELAGLPGFMRKVTDVTDATRTLTIDGALPAGAFGADAATLAARHTRVRRWDHAGQVRDTAGNVHFDLNSVGSPGVIPVPVDGTALLLEDGIRITFSLADPGGRFRAGDYWVFAARTADASVEELVEAPPRGVHHHYCRLAVVTFPQAVSDCRTLWPPEFGEGGCDCTVCVTAESHNGGTLTIQQAIDRVRATGGTVCLGAGIYVVSEAFVLVEGAQSVRVRGQGWRTVLAHAGRGPAIVVRGCVGFTMENLAVLTARDAEGAADVAADVAVENSANVTLQECYFLQPGRARQPRAAIGLGGVLLYTRIRSNVIFADAGIANASAQRTDDDAQDPRRPLMTLGLYCENNQILCRRHGVRLAGFCLHLGDTVIAGNFVSGAGEGGLVATGALSAEAWGGSRLDVLRNTLRVGGDGIGDGIVVGTDDARIDGNDVGPETQRQSRDGIAIAPGLLRRPLNRLQVTNNRVVGLGRHGIHIRTAVRSGLIKQNQIEAVGGGGIVMDDEGSAEDLVIENNQLLRVANVTAAASEAEPMLAGIHVVRVRDVAILNNVLRDVGARASLSRRLAGIQAVSCIRARVAGNRVINLGPMEAQLRDADAIAILGLCEHADVADNVVLRQEKPPAQGQDPSLWRGVRIGPENERPLLVGNLVLVRTTAIEALLTAGRAVIRLIAPEAAHVRGNAVSAFGAAPAMLIVSQGRVLVHDNRASLVPPIRVPVALVAAAALLFSNNSFEGGQGDHDVVRLQTNRGPFTATGNIASGLIRHNGGRLPDPWKPLNVEMV